MQLNNKTFIQRLFKSRIIKTQKIVRAMLTVDRADFCREPYIDTPCYLGYGATISAPHMHSFALNLLEDKLSKGCCVLDVGAGSGYLTAAFAYMEQAIKVVGIEHVPQLVQLAIKNISKNHRELLQSGLVKIVRADARAEVGGTYKVIHVGAACEEVPKSLLSCLQVGGRMVVPIGRQQQGQWYTVIDKMAEQEYRTTKLMEVRYIPLTSLEHQLRD